MNATRKSRSIWLDPRTKLVLLLLCVIAASLAPFRSYNTGLVLLACFYGILLGKTRYALIGAAIYAIIYLFTILVLTMGSGTLQTMLVAFLGLWFKVFPCCIVGGVSIKTTPINEFLSAMNRMRVPKKIVIPFAVMLRYMPTIKEDWHYIKDAMKMRDISPSLKSFLTKPAMTVECIYVPLMMSASNVADELSIASVTRGIENPRRRTCITKIRFGIADIFMILLFAIYLVSAFFI